MTASISGLVVFCNHILSSAKAAIKISVASFCQHWTMCSQGLSCIPHQGNLSLLCCSLHNIVLPVAEIPAKCLVIKSCWWGDKDLVVFWKSSQSIYPIEANEKPILQLQYSLALVKVQFMTIVTSKFWTTNLLFTETVQPSSGCQVLVGDSPFGYGIYVLWQVCLCVH